MEKTSLTPCPLRDPPDGYGTFQAPSPFIQIPGRAYGDERMHKYPKTFLILSLCCAHSNSKKGSTFWVNQRTFAAMLKVSQQTISQSMNRLVEWKYIEKIRRENPLRPFSKQGAVWRVIYEPRYSLEQAIKYAPEEEKSPQQEYQEAQNTIDKAAKGPLGHTSKGRKTIQAPACTTASNKDEMHKVQLVSRHKVQLVQNHYNRTIDIKDKESSCLDICKCYSRILREQAGRDWQYDDRQVRLAGELIDLGYTLEKFERDAYGVVSWLKRTDKQPPTSLQYFVKRKARRDNPTDDAKSILAHATARLKV